jgi:hypothetical protein
LKLVRELLVLSESLELGTRVALDDFSRASYPAHRLAARADIVPT